MEQFVEVFKLISPSALPLVVVLLGGFWIYRKTQNIEQARKVTKIERDQDSQKMHDDLIKLQFKVAELDGIVVHHKDLLLDMNKQINLLNTNIAILTEKISHLTEIMEIKNDKQITC